VRLRRLKITPPRYYRRLGNCGCLAPARPSSAAVVRSPRYRLPSPPLRRVRARVPQACVVGQGSSRALTRPCLPPRLRRCGSSCRATSRGRCRSGPLRRALTPPLCRSSSAPPRSPPRTTFRRSSSLVGGLARPSALGLARLRCRPPTRANAVAVLLRQRYVANPLRPRNFGGTRSLVLSVGCCAFHVPPSLCFIKPKGSFAEG
jgi:hypothetical protein